ncbi:MCE family protein [Mycobacteroides abscessus subsp. bolletii]|uniref:MlaD family protein n=1 Tax=Mycobacteroides abscessus TaxID=36809 RepID=UPI0019D2FE8E|nr:MlaD family protein [Mycobacteroides abscessus]MBN7303130.1 MCE family protein [Mycobacteroides abscessus subsp. bolletii]
MYSDAREDVLMLRRVLASRGFISITGVLLAAAVVATGLAVYQWLDKKIGYCAIMPDAIGLYQGNDVLVRGVKVGTVTGIRPQGTGVRVDFDVDATYPLRGNAIAATVSDTIVADRHLAVQGSPGDPWDSGRCITQTVTPKSLTQMTNAVTTLATDLQAGTDPDQRRSIERALKGIDQATVGTGTQFNDNLMQLAASLRTPGVTAAHIGALIDSVTQLSQSVANGWGNLREMLNGFAPILQLVNDIWGQVVAIVDTLTTILPWFNDITRSYGEPIMHLLEDVVPYIHWLAQDVPALENYSRLAPAISWALRKFGKAGRLAVNYFPPFVRLNQPDADRLCSLLNAADQPRRIHFHGPPGPPIEGACFDYGNGQAKVNLVPLVLGMTGAQ